MNTKRMEKPIFKLFICRDNLSPNSAFVELEKCKERRTITSSVAVLRHTEYEYNIHENAARLTCNETKEKP